MAKPLLKQGVDYSGWRLSGSAVVEALLAVPQLPPVLPFRVWQTAQRWEKKCHVATWKMATADPATLARWWRAWPDARPGIPIRGSGLAVIDVDDPADPAFAKAWAGPRIDGVRQRYRDREDGWSLERTPSGGYHIIFAMPDPPIVGKIQWSPSVEVIGERFLFVCHDLRELASPRRRAREVLPEAFWKAFAGGALGRGPRCSYDGTGERVRDAKVVANLTAALEAMDPRDWHEEFKKWFELASACKAEGISLASFSAWSRRDPKYRNDAADIARYWEAARGDHGGALFAALAERGIKVGKHSPTHSAPTHNIDVSRAPPQSANAKPSANPRGSKFGLRKTIHWPSRVAHATAQIHARQDDDTLFAWSCVVAETHFECGNPPLAKAYEYLEGACPKLIRERGIEAVRRTIRRAFAQVASKLTEANNA